MYMCVFRYLSKRQHHWGGTTISNSTLPSRHPAPTPSNPVPSPSVPTLRQILHQPSSHQHQKLRTEMGFQLSVFACFLFPKRWHIFYSIVWVYDSSNGNHYFVSVLILNQLVFRFLVKNHCAPQTSTCLLQSGVSRTPGESIWAL